jgi:hypothetical protein
MTDPTLTPKALSQPAATTTPPTTGDKASGALSFVNHVAKY